MSRQRIMAITVKSKVKHAQCQEDIDALAEEYAAQELSDDMASMVADLLEARASEIEDERLGRVCVDGVQKAGEMYKFFRDNPEIAKGHQNRRDELRRKGKPLQAAGAQVEDIGRVIGTLAMEFFRKS